MSFVLDALRRAEAERQRGSVPGLHAQTLAAPSEPTSDRSRPAWVLPVGAVLAVAVIAAGFVGWWRSPEVAPAPASSAVPGLAPAAVSEAAPAVGPAAIPAPASALTPVPAAMQPPAAAPQPNVARPAARPATPAVPEARPAPRPAQSAPEPAPRPAARPERVQRFQDLPDAVRRQIPPMAFGGATDSPDRAARMLLINGQIWREGDEPANGLRLERISLRSAVFLWRDERFEVVY
jgi:general secretion pathway protein B